MLFQRDVQLFLKKDPSLHTLLFIRVWEVGGGDLPTRPGLVVLPWAATFGPILPQVCISSERVTCDLPSRTLRGLVVDVKVPPLLLTNIGFPGGSDGKESACNAGDPG